MQYCKLLQRNHKNNTEINTNKNVNWLETEA